MTEPFQPPPEDLPPSLYLMDLSDVSEEDVRAAAEKWIKNPPDPDFQNILKAEDDE